MRIAVVVPVRRAESTIGRTIASLTEQTKGLDAEIIVAVSDADPTCKLVRSLQLDYGFRLLVIPGRHSVPELRRDAVRATEAAYVFITEDHCVFPDAWIPRLVDALDGAVVSGGGVKNGRRSWTGWAQYFTRYAIFQPPLENGLTRHLPGNNACYKREVLERYGHLLKDGFWEAEFNAEVVKSEPFRMVADCEVIQHQRRGLFEYIPLRFQHGRCYGARRPDRNLARVPLIPAILFWRAVRAVFSRRGNRLRFLILSPVLLAYFAAWAAGEAWGYCFGAGDSCSHTD